MFDSALLGPSIYKRLNLGEWPPDSRSKAELFVQRVIFDGVPLILRSAELPPMVVEVLRRSGLELQRRLARQNDTFDAMMVRLPELLRGESFVLLKGADYRYRFYDDSALRPMKDIDILVPRDGFQPACTMLRDAGATQRYTGRASHVPMHHEATFDLDGVTIDLHHAFFQPTRYSIDYDALWSRRVTLATPHGIFLRLDDTDAILCHAAKMATDLFPIKVFTMLDFLVLIDENPRKAAEVRQRAREWHVERALYAALRLTKATFPELWQPHLDCYEVDLLPPRVRSFLDRRVLPLGDGIREKGHRWQVARKIFLLAGVADQLHFLAHYAGSSIKDIWWKYRSGPS